MGSNGRLGTQIANILQDLEDGKSVTPLYALNRYGCFRLSGVIFALRKQGHDIRTELVSNGERTYARYFMPSRR